MGFRHREDRAREQVNPDLDRHQKPGKAIKIGTEANCIAVTREDRLCPRSHMGDDHGDRRGHQHGNCGIKVGGYLTGITFGP
jgi:hypothetical protein